MIHDVLLAAIKSRGWRMIDVERATGVPATTVHDTLRARRDIRLDVAAKIAQAVGMSPDAFGRLCYEHHPIAPLEAPIPPSRASVAEVAQEIAAQPPPITTWVRPRANWVTSLRKAGWPMRLEPHEIVQTGHRRHNRGKPVAVVVQQVTTVPESWLQVLADRLQVDLEYATTR